MKRLTGVSPRPEHCSRLELSIYDFSWASGHGEAGAIFQRPKTKKEDWAFDTGEVRLVNGFSNSEKSFRGRPTKCGGGTAANCRKPKALSQLFRALKTLFAQLSHYILRDKNTD